MNCATEMTRIYSMSTVPTSICQRKLYLWLVQWCHGPTRSSCKYSPTCCCASKMNRKAVQGERPQCSWVRLFFYRRTLSEHPSGSRPSEIRARSIVCKVRHLEEDTDHMDEQTRTLLNGLLNCAQKLNKDFLIGDKQVVKSVCLDSIRDGPWARPSSVRLLWHGMKCRSTNRETKRSQLFKLVIKFQCQTCRHGVSQRRPVREYDL